MINDLTGREKTHRNEETDWDYVMDSLLGRRSGWRCEIFFSFP